MSLLDLRFGAGNTKSSKVGGKLSAAFRLPFRLYSFVFELCYRGKRAGGCRVVLVCEKRFSSWVPGVPVPVMRELAEKRMPALPDVRRGSEYCLNDDLAASGLFRENVFKRVTVTILLHLFIDACVRLVDDEYNRNAGDRGAFEAPIKDVSIARRRLVECVLLIP